VYWGEGGERMEEKWEKGGYRLVSVGPLLDPATEVGWAGGVVRSSGERGSGRKKRGGGSEPDLLDNF